MSGKQCVRLIRSGDSKSIQHLDYWIGGLLVDLGLGLGQGVQPVHTHEYYEHIAELFADMLVNETLSVVTVKTITNKVVYAEMTSTFPPPKVVRESDRTITKFGADFTVLWWRPGLGTPCTCCCTTSCQWLRGSSGSG